MMAKDAISGDAPPLPESFPEFVRLALSFEVGDFVARYPYPFLVVKALKEGDTAQGFDTEDIDRDTVVGASGKTPSPGKIPPDASSFVRPVLHRGTHHYDVYTVGRTKNNDICLASSFISKFHAYFKKEGDSWTLTDSGSSNGTEVEGQRVASRKPVKIDSGTSIRFGRAYAATFFSPAAVYRFAGLYRRFAGGQG